MLTAPRSNLINAPANTSSTEDMTRRQALSHLAAGLSCVFGALAVPRGAHADEPQDMMSCYALRNVERTYELWASQSKSTHLPPLEVFREALSVCRESACSIFLMQENWLSACHSGLVVNIPKEHQTASSRGKLYVVTCDHARLNHAGTRPIVQLPNGKNIQPLSELVVRAGKRGIPLKDLRIYECHANAFDGVRTVPLKSIDAELPLHAPVMTYEPLNLRARQIVDEQKQAPLLEPGMQSKKVLEKFILTHISHPTGFPHDPSYPESSGFNTAGQLKVGGSGSPVIVFTEKDFALAGHQVSYGHSHDTESEERIDGEIDHDGNVVHIGHAIQLLQEKGRWR
jgi:hypothetical protein